MRRKTVPPFEEHAQNGSRSRCRWGKFLDCMAARDSALCAYIGNYLPYQKCYALKRLQSGFSPVLILRHGH